LVAFFSVTVDGRNLIFGHKRHIGIPYWGINTTTVPAEGNSSKRPIVFNNCQVTNNKKKNIPENDKQKVLFSQCSK
jgi:hypothetical protein